ncbi:hypothetical protein D9M71_754340 [compost metagenome]
MLKQGSYLDFARSSFRYLDSIVLDDSSGANHVVNRLVGEFERVFQPLFFIVPILRIGNVLPFSQDPLDEFDVVDQEYDEPNAYFVRNLNIRVGIGLSAVESLVD